ncbi:VOC family protein [Williamsia sp. M5A3_1d]
MPILRSFARIYTTDLDAHLAARELLGVTATGHRRFALPDRGLQVMITDDTVIVAGDDDALAAVRDTQITWLVDDLDETLSALRPQIERVVTPPTRVPTGRNATVRLSDVQVELVQWDDGL